MTTEAALKEFPVGCFVVVLTVDPYEDNPIRGTVLHHQPQNSGCVIRTKDGRVGGFGWQELQRVDFLSKVDLLMLEPL